MKNHDVLFKIGVGLQALLIPAAFLWRFSPEANYYNWAVAILSLAVLVLCFWPQATIVRLKRLKAIKIQLIVVVSLLVVSWLAYAYFYHFTRSHCYPPFNVQTNYTVPTQPNSSYCRPEGMVAIYTVNWHTVFGRNWVMLLGPGIGVLSAVGLTALFVALPAANLYRYKIDKKRLKGIKKDELFA